MLSKTVFQSKNVRQQYTSVATYLGVATCCPGKCCWATLLPCRPHASGTCTQTYSYAIQLQTCEQTVSLRQAEIDQEAHQCNKPDTVCNQVRTLSSFNRPRTCDRTWTCSQRGCDLSTSGLAPRRGAKDSTTPVLDC